MASPAGSPLGAHAVERIHRLGPLSFSELLELALYHPELGFFKAAGGAGRRGAALRRLRMR